MLEMNPFHIHILTLYIHGMNMRKGGKLLLLTLHH
jgi:hypothetical protein